MGVVSSIDFFGSNMANPAIWYHADTGMAEAKHYIYNRTGACIGEWPLCIININTSSSANSNSRFSCGSSRKTEINWLVRGLLSTRTVHVIRKFKS